MALQRRVRGFTLIELMISVTILGLVIGIASFAFSLFSRHWDGPKSGFERASGQMQRLDLVSRSLSDTLPWIVKNDNGALGFYFLGRDEGFTFVTSSPIYSVGSPAVVRLFREPEGRGRWRLVYEEAPLSGTLLRSGAQTLPFQHRLVILNNLSDVSFRYFGWSSLQDKLRVEDISGSSSLRWWGDYDGLSRVQQPQRIGIKLDGFEAVFELPERTEALLNRASPPL